MVSFDLLGPSPETSNGNVYVFLIVDLFSRHAEGYAMTKEDKTAMGCASRVVDYYIPRGGCPHTFLSDRETEFISQVRRTVVYETLGRVEELTSSYHP